MLYVNPSAPLVTNPHRKALQKVFTDLLIKHKPDSIDLTHVKNYVFHNVHTKESLAKNLSSGDSSYQDTAFNKYRLIKGKFYHSKFLSFASDTRSGIDELVVLDDTIIPTKMALLADMDSHDMVGEIYIDDAGGLYGIAYFQPYIVQPGVIEPDTLALLLPIAKYAKKKNEDYGEMFYNPDTNTIWVVGDDGMKNKHMDKIYQKAEDAGFDIDVEAEWYPQEEGWLLVETDGTVTVYRVDE